MDHSQTIPAIILAFGLLLCLGVYWFIIWRKGHTRKRKESFYRGKNNP